jgi:1,2-diacylglycerol 3-alpha-glucosyltransferase
MDLVVLFHRLGPYHHARLKALASRSVFAVVEFSGVDNTYAWDVVTADTGIQKETLFEDTDIDSQPICTINAKINVALGNLRPQAIAIPGWSSPAALAALLWCCQNCTPAILMSDSTAHDERRVWLMELIKSMVVRLFSAALVGGEPHVDYVEALGLPRTRAFVGYDVVDNAYFADEAERVRRRAESLKLEHGLPDRFFLASNRFIDKKNLSRLLDAYSAYVLRANEHAWDLVILGDGELKAVLVEQAARLGLANKLFFLGFKQYDDLPVFYGLASAFIQASTTEQWGLVVNEAMASGLPVLVSERCGCAPDLVKNGVNGYTFDPYDIKELTERMLQLPGQLRFGFDGPSESGDHCALVARNIRHGHDESCHCRNGQPAAPSWLV